MSHDLNAQHTSCSDCECNDDDIVNDNLMKNTVLAATRAWHHTQLAQWDLKYLPLKPLEKVPSDIEVARAQTPKDVGMLANEIGILSSELDMYGKKKAKVSLSVLDRLQGRKNGKYVVVAGITPTPLGEQFNFTKKNFFGPNSIFFCNIKKWPKINF